MSSDELRDIASTVLKLAEPGQRPKQLFEAVRQQHPKASKKQIVRATFYAVISAAEGDLQKARLLQDFALKERGGADE